MCSMAYPRLPADRDHQIHLALLEVEAMQLLQRHIDRIRDSRENSHVRSWEWLMGKLKSALVEVREDQK